MIDKKRRELEGFIREQTLGPGAMRSRFVNLQEQPTVPAGTGPLSPFHAELINTVPAGVYSTGILFPVDDTNKGVESDKTAKIDADDQAPLPKGDQEDDGDEADVEEENVHIDAQSLNQMYPNSVGLTVCLDQQVVQDNDLEIIISGRYYRKMDLKIPGVGIGVALEQDRAVFEAFLGGLAADDVIRANVKVGVAKKGGMPYIYLASNTTSVQDMRKRLYEIKRERGDAFGVEAAKQYKSLDTLKERLFNELRSSILPNSDPGKKMLDILKRIEVIENSLAHLQDLISVHDSAGYGIWKCETFAHRIGESLPIPTGFKGKHSYLHGSEPVLANIHWVEYAKDKWASLAVNLQFSKYERGDRAGDRLYLKIQLVNTSTHFSDKDTKNGKNYFSLASEEVNKRCFFGVGIQVKSRKLIPSRDMRIEEKKGYNEEELNRYIYRQFKDRGLGHGCSVTWGEQMDVPFVSTEYVPTHETPDVDPIPRYKHGPMEKLEGNYSPRAVFADTRFLQFKWLSTLSEISDQELIDGLKEFVGAYEAWIEVQQDKDHPGMVAHIRGLCREDQSRMLTNIEEILSAKEGITCFRLMNTAMFMQLWHSEKVKHHAVDDAIKDSDFKGFFEPFYKEKADDRLFSTEESAAWRPFQLAFILLNLDGIFQRTDDQDWTARNEWVDLVWFPTGGGKTEAYLGLIALTIIKRRRKWKEHGGGTAVIMRYTLRLLTTQQFQRATLLIMALELIRRWGTYNLQEEPIYIGLFVGKGSLPNKLKGNNSLDEEYAKLKAGQAAGRANRSKIPLRKCPWCGHDLNPINYYEEDAGGTYTHNRILLACSRPDRSCAFSMDHPFPPPLDRQDQGPIPVSLCDEEIYQHPPALLFGTVDKFAQIAHKISDHDAKRQADSRRLFGKGNWERGKPKKGYLPPDLIIQDELHLMMGPLGSAVALFESAIDQLCTREVNGKKARPKVISSTATTRNTPLQIMALFDRKVNVFPKPGIDCDDSFFAFYKREASDEQGNEPRYISKRKYIGILPTGRTQMWMQLRLAAILFTHRALFEKESLGVAEPFDDNAYSKELVKAIDYYHTVLAYFNSLREVGKTESQIYSYLVKEIRRVFNKVMRPDKLMHCFYTYASSFHNGELTGRLSGEEVVNEMERIGADWSPEMRSAHGTRPERGTTPPDLVIATNMISVGIDISRFNCMIMNCMPRNIAEYIQASSRVARDKPGLVITVHHPFRSRDISHYERFIEFHEKMYSYVEPISITPFTRKALERYLPLYIATIIRHRAGYVDRMDANIFLDEHRKNELLQCLRNYFKNRMDHLQEMKGIEEALKGLLTKDQLADIDHLVEDAINEWQAEHEQTRKGNMDLVFNYRSDKAKTPQRQLYVDIDEYQDNIRSELWRIPQSLRVVEPEAVIHVKQK